MGGVSLGATQMDIKGGDSHAISLRKGQEEKEKGEQEETEIVYYSGELDLENTCLPNVFGPQPAWSIDSLYRNLYKRKKMPENNNLKDISMCCIGDAYVDFLEQHIGAFPDWKFWILTDKPERVKKILKDKRHRVIEYSKPRFNYFDKLLWALDTVMATGRPVLQMDAKRIGYRIHIVEDWIDDVSMIRALYNKPVYENSAYFLGIWSPGMKACHVPQVTNRDLRFDLNYWNEIVEYMGEDSQHFAPTLEHCTVFSLSKEKARAVYDNLVEIEPLFRKASTKFKTPYKGVSSGEGLALGWAFYINNINTRPLLKIQDIKAHNPIDFTHGWNS